MSSKGIRENGLGKIELTSQISFNLAISSTAGANSSPAARENISIFNLEFFNQEKFNIAPGSKTIMIDKK